MQKKSDLLTCQTANQWWNYKTKSAKTLHPTLQLNSPGRGALPIAGLGAGRFLRGSWGVTPKLQGKLETWGLLGSLYFSFSYLLHLSQKLRIHCFVCQNQYPVATVIQMSGYFDLLECQTMLYCYWYHQTCSLKRKFAFASIFSLTVLFCPHTAITTVQPLNEDTSKERDHPIWIIIIVHSGNRFSGLGKTIVQTSVQLPFLMYTRQKGKHVHAYTGYVFKCLEISTPAIKWSTLTHLCV